ncbi:DoxX family protein [uncultured Hymenobacter sp.]|uniref:DoxX family protein n=1 Tax=uncultured Hymenobacter sp. TaxID=170016 RepID=UPI0035CB7A96
MNIRNIIAWVLAVLLAVVFIKSGFDKLSDLDKTTGMFGSMGLPGWMAALVGGAELLGGIGLLVPRTTRLAALGLMAIMLGAVVMHATKIPGGISGGTFAIGLLVGLAILYFLRRPEPLTTDRMAV